MTNQNQTYFELYCVIVHKGIHIDGGHYVAFCWRGDQWYEMDDHRVYEIFGGCSSKHVLSKEGYIFLYKWV